MSTWKYSTNYLCFFASSMKARSRSYTDSNSGFMLTSIKRWLTYASTRWTIATDGTEDMNWSSLLLVTSALKAGSLPMDTLQVTRSTRHQVTKTPTPRLNAYAYWLEQNRCRKSSLMWHRRSGVLPMRWEGHYVATCSTMNLKLLRRWGWWFIRRGAWGDD